jgi:hypothetical protein
VRRTAQPKLLTYTFQGFPQISDGLPLNWNGVKHTYVRDPTSLYTQAEELLEEYRFLTAH